MKAARRAAWEWPSVEKEAEDMYKRTFQGWLRHLDFVCLDEGSLFLAVLLAAALGKRLGYPLEGGWLRRITLLAMTADLVVFALSDALHNVMERGCCAEFTATLRHVLFVFALGAVAALVMRGSITIPGPFAESLLSAYVALSYATRVLWKRFVHIQRKRGWHTRNMLVVTSTASAPEILRRLRGSAYSVVGVVLLDRDARGEMIEGAEVVANVDDAADYVCRAWIDEVFFFQAACDSRGRKLLEQCLEMALTVHLCAAMQGSGEQKQVLEQIAGYEVLTTNINLMSALDAALKRLLDILAGLGGSAIALLVIAVFGPMIRLASPGPLLYSQVRVGENGRKFRMYKLRSMYVDADRRKETYFQENSHTDGMMFKMDFDPRVVGNRILPDGTQKTGIGDFIRRTSLDEFPQFFNVLRGEMSVVGTRPPTLDEWEQYQLRHRARLSIRPGLTGLWQISERKDSMSFEEIVRLDMDYIANWSIGRDIQIIGKTAWSMLRRLRGQDAAHGSYGKAAPGRMNGSPPGRQ